MLPLLLLLFVGLPVLELYVLIQVGSEVGAFTAIYLVLLTAIVGIWLVRRQGMGVISRIRAASDRGEAPAVEMIEGGLLLVSGLCLLIPGFVTDVAGFLLLIPPLRKVIVIAVVRRVKVAEVHVQREGRPRERPAIDTTWEREDD